MGWVKKALLTGALKLTNPFHEQEMVAGLIGERQP